VRLGRERGSCAPTPPALRAWRSPGRPGRGAAGRTAPATAPAASPETTRYVCLCIYAYLLVQTAFHFKWWSNGERRQPAVWLVARLHQQTAPASAGSVACYRGFAHTVLHTPGRAALRTGRSKQGNQLPCKQTGQCIPSAVDCERNRAHSQCCDTGYDSHAPAGHKRKVRLPSSSTATSSVVTSAERLSCLTPGTEQASCQPDIHSLKTCKMVPSACWFCRPPAAGRGEQGRRLAVWG